MTVQAPEPARAAADYLSMLLREDQRSFENVQAPIHSLVVSVPEVWQREVNNRGAEQLKQIIEQELRLPLDRLMSEPVCAAAYYAYQHEQVYGPFAGNVLVCDMGGGTFDAALCSINGQKVNVLCFDGNGRRELGLAGVTFDHQAVTTAWLDLHHKQPDMTSRTFLELLRNFEEEKVNRDLTEELEAIRQFPDAAADTPLYSLMLHDEEYEFDCSKLQNAFLPIRKGIQEVLTRIKAKAEQRGWEIHRRIVVGGFGQFFLVQQAINEIIPLSYPDAAAEDFDQKIGFEPGIVAYGAVLVANGIVDPVEYYPHAIGVRVHYQTYNECAPVYKEVILPIIKADHIPTDQPGKIYYLQDEQGAERMRVAVKAKSGRLLPLPVRIQRLGEGEWIELNTGEQELPPAGTYHVGLTLDRSNLVTLIFEPVAGELESNKRLYQLGQLNFDLIVEGP